MNHTFSYLVSTFFASYLRNEQGFPKNTIASYSDCFKLLIQYVCQQQNIELEAITIEMIDRELLLGFLGNLESTRNNCASTRNQRLAALKTFFHFVARTNPALMRQNELIQAIKAKKTDYRPPPSLTTDEVAAITAAPDIESLLGARDTAILQLLYNTGARVQELVDLDIADIHFEGPFSVTLTGKGSKTRVVPLWDETVKVINHYLSVRKCEGIESDHLFLNKNKKPITRFGIGRMINKYANKAASDCKSLKDRKITPHVFRHTTALHLIEADNDISVVKDWLGHADIRTTSLYLEVSIERKRKALAKLPPLFENKIPEIAQWKKPDLLSFLSKLSEKEHYVA
jgi:site-specific recombinase XerD